MARAVEAVAHHLVIAAHGGKYASSDGWERFKEDRPRDAAHHEKRAADLVRVVGVALVQEGLDASGGDQP